MSRRKKNLRAFLHQLTSPTIEQAWDAAWISAQKRHHTKNMQELERNLGVLSDEVHRLGMLCSQQEDEILKLQRLLATTKVHLTEARRRIENGDCND